jgi:purine-binding chemotaxis protein CheW
MPQLCTFYVADLYMGVSVLDVQEVLNSRPMSSVPLTADCVRGLINLRGQIVTAIDLRRRMGLPDFADEQAWMNLVVRGREGVASLLVDRMGDVVEVLDEDFEPLPGSVEGRFRELMRGVYKLDGRLLLLLDIEKALHV